MLAIVTDSTCGLTRNEAAELGVDVHEVGKWQSGNAVWQAVLGKGEEEHHV